MVVGVFLLALAEPPMVLLPDAADEFSAEGLPLEVQGGAKPFEVVIFFA